MPKKEGAFIDQMIEKFGDNIYNHKRELQAISTGCLSLDTSIGIGGIPKGMITEMFGPEGSGKTTIALNTAKQVVLGGGKVLYIDVENLLNEKLLKSVLGADTDISNIIILTPNSAEDAFMMAEGGIDSEEFELVVIDTIGAMASRKEKDVPFDKDTMGKLPQVVGKFIKRNTYQIRTKNVAVLLLNQIRDDIGAYMKSFKTPGGHQLQHEAAVRIFLRRGENLIRGKEIVGIITKFSIKKNKLAPPFRSFTIPIIFGQGIDYYSDLIDFSKLLGVIRTGGAYYKLDDETIGKGKAEVRERLMSDKSTLDKIVERVYNIVNHETNIAELLNEMEDSIEDEELDA